MERGTVEWWNGGIVELWVELLTTLYRFYSCKWTNWACALAKTWMVWIRIPGYLSLENYLHLYKCVKRSLYV